MKKLTRLQYQTVFLYSKGLTFKEIDNVLKIHSKAYYSQVLYKDKGRITRAKRSREINQKNYHSELSFYMDEVKRRNRKCNSSYQSRYTIEPIQVKAKFRIDYIQECILKSCSSYNRYKITFVRKIHEKVA